MHRSFAAPHRLATRCVTSWATLCAALLATTLLACGEQIVVPDTPAQLEQVGPARLEPTSALSARAQLGLPYVVRDAEGDDIALSFEVCEASGQACGSPIQGAGSDGVAFIPTDPFGGPVSRLFVWDIACGRISPQGRRLSVQPGDSYTFTVRVAGAEEVSMTSAPFSPAELGLSALPPCDSAS